MRCHVNTRRHQTSFKDEEAPVLCPKHAGFLRNSLLYCVKGGCGRRVADMDTVVTTSLDIREQAWAARGRQGGA